MTDPNKKPLDLLFSWKLKVSVLVDIANSSLPDDQRSHAAPSLSPKRGGSPPPLPKALASDPLLHSTAPEPTSTAQLKSPPFLNACLSLHGRSQTSQQQPSPPPSHSEHPLPTPPRIAASPLELS